MKEVGGGVGGNGGAEAAGEGVAGAAGASSCPTWATVEAVYVSMLYVTVVEVLFSWCCLVSAQPCEILILQSYEIQLHVQRIAILLSKVKTRMNAFYSNKRSVCISYLIKRCILGCFKKGND